MRKKVLFCLLFLIVDMSLIGCTVKEKKPIKEPSNAPIVNYEIPDKNIDFDIQFIPDNE